ncbi:MAG: ketoacyl-ACP synthase III [Verrucomicrobia bacterium]|nr:ketoacyl-ACP synthase III [Verrucomicrobiota bacterium]
MKKPLATITATASYLPERILSNHDLEQMVETSDEWIVTRTGIRERRIAASDEYASTMGAKSALAALQKANVEPGTIDAIIVTTMTPDFLCPSTAALIQHQIGAMQAAAIDVQAACTGFLYGLSIARAWIESGAYKKVLVISTEKNSSFVDYQDRNTCVLFGDGSAAALVEDGGPGYAIRHICLGADGQQAALFTIPGGGSHSPASSETCSQGQHFMKMEGREIFKHAVRRMEASAKECLDAVGMQEADISWLIPHQANIRIIDAIAKRFAIADERVVRTIQKYGNTNSSTIPIALAELDREHAPKEGENLLLTAFGGGLTWGSAIITKVSS